MVGTYIIGDLEVVNPTLTVFTLEVDYISNSIKVQVNLSDTNDSGTITIPEPNEIENIPASTTKQAIKNWAENYLKRYKA